MSGFDFSKAQALMDETYRAAAKGPPPGAKVEHATHGIGHLVSFNRGTRIAMVRFDSDGAERSFVWDYAPIRRVR